MMLVGDEAQLPPVGQTESTAMNPARLRRLGLNPICGTLDIPARQAADSGIVHNATIVRQLLFNSVPGLPAALDVTGFPEIAAISSVELAEVLADSYAAVRGGGYNNSDTVQQACQQFQPGHPPDGDVCRGSHSARRPPDRGQE